MLFGDSMLARFTKPHIRQLEQELGGTATVHNCAAGGWDSSDGLARAPLLARIGWAAVVLSFGANDCAPWKRVPLDRFAANLAAIAAAFEGSRLVAFLPPQIREIEQPVLGTRRNRDLDLYRDVLRAAAGPGACLETGRILAGKRPAPRNSRHPSSTKPDASQQNIPNTDDLGQDCPREGGWLEEDGLHLTDESYALLIPTLARVIAPRAREGRKAST